MPISVELKGRLGNQLFQYAALRNISIKNGYDIFIDTNFMWHGQQCLLSYFKLHEYSLPGPIYYNYSQPHNSTFFDSNIYNISDNTLLHGHFENVEYFNENLDIIKDELIIKDDNINNSINNFIKYIMEEPTILEGASINSLILPSGQESKELFMERMSICENSTPLNNYNETHSDLQLEIQGQQVPTNELESKLVVIHFRLGDLIQQLHCSDEHIKNTQDFAFESLETIMKTEPSIKIIVIGGGLRKGTNMFIPRTHEDDMDIIKNFVSECNCKYNHKIHISPGTLEDNEIFDYGLISKCHYVISPYQSTFSFMAYYTSKTCIKLFSPTNLYGVL